jgi:cell division septation protein DedD
MRNKDTGEFELVVGDRQLLSAFFIGVLLLAVVFAMGYVLGQSSPKSAKVAPDTAAVPASTVADNRPPAAIANPVPRSSEPATTPAQAADTGAAQPVETPPQPTTVPARESVAPAAPPKVQLAPDPANATYWQVLAGSQNSADAMSQTLKGRGFPVSTRSGPNNLTLVWVGPYTDKESLTRAKKQLEDAGITTLYKKP